MSSQAPSIQAYFKTCPSPPPGLSRDNVQDEAPSDNVRLEPVLQTWIPETDYPDVDIAALETGPRCVSVMGRIVNIYDLTMTSKMPQAARGFVKMIVKDDTGAMTVIIS